MDVPVHHLMHNNALLLSPHNVIALSKHGVKKVGDQTPHAITGTGGGAGFSSFRTATLPRYGATVLEFGDATLLSVAYNAATGELRRWLTYGTYQSETPDLGPVFAGGDPDITHLSGESTNYGITQINRYTGATVNTNPTSGSGVICDQSTNWPTGMAVDPASIISTITYNIGGSSISTTEVTTFNLYNWSGSVGVMLTRIYGWGNEITLRDVVEDCQAIFRAMPAPAPMGPSYAATKNGSGQIVNGISSGSGAFVYLSGSGAGGGMGLYYSADPDNWDGVLLQDAVLYIPTPAAMYLSAATYTIGGVTANVFPPLPAPSPAGYYYIQNIGPWAVQTALFGTAPATPGPLSSGGGLSSGEDVSSGG